MGPTHVSATKADYGDNDTFKTVFSFRASLNRKYNTFLAACDRLEGMKMTARKGANGNFRF